MLIHQNTIYLGYFPHLKTKKKMTFHSRHLLTSEKQFVIQQKLIFCIRFDTLSRIAITNRKCIQENIL